jgi:hypothetical protein
MIVNKDFIGIFKPRDRFAFEEVNSVFVGFFSYGGLVLSVF